MRRSHAGALGFAAIASLAVRSVHAEPSAFLSRVLPASVDTIAPKRSSFVVVELPPHLDPLKLGARPIAPGLAVIAGDAPALASFSRAHPEVSVELHPPLRPKLDTSGAFIGISPSTALDGRGTYVGIVDTGIDIFHRDFRNEDGTTRIARFLDFATEKRPGNELDERYGARVWDRAELDALIAGTKIDLAPSDSDGHGTHVAGIAASSNAKYRGVAPGAELIIVRASDAQGNVDEGAAVLGAKFVFDRADEMKRPAVVNLSLGTQYGAHDGTSAFERGLVALARGPGRAVVVAASNEGHIPIHTSVRVTPGEPFHIPVRLRGSNGNGAPYGDAQVFIWINTRDRGELRGVAVRGPDGEPWIRAVKPGEALESNPRAGVRVIVANEDQRVFEGDATTGAVVVLTGPLPVGDFELVLEGDAATELWLQGARQAVDGPGMPLFARGGQIEGTIGIPASAAGLIAVGSVTSRTSFVNRKNERLVIDEAVLGTRSFFSSAGPAANGALRPDFLAPGHYVISSVARSAFLAVPNGPFGEEQLVDDEHGVLAGTSMSSPFGAGAIALLFQKDSTLTQEQARAALQAGCRPLADDPNARDYAVGAGILDVDGAIAALDRRAAPPRASSLFLRLGSSYLAADGKLPVWGLAIARDASGRPADVEGGVAVELDGAIVQTPIEHPSVGLYRFAIAAAPNRGGTDATITLRGALSLSRTLPIGADRWDARDGLRAGGGCAMGAAQGSPTALALLLLMFLRRSRARNRAHGTAARRDGTGAADRPR